MIISKSPGGYLLGGLACFGVAAYALVTGEVPTKGAGILRAASPQKFWIAVTLLGAFGVGCLAWAMRLMGRAGGE
jgi:hypothetical protein